MRVKDLIEQLEKFNPEDVAIVLYEFGSKPVEYVSEVDTIYDADGVSVYHEKVLIQ